MTAITVGTRVRALDNVYKGRSSSPTVPAGVEGSVVRVFTDEFLAGFVDVAWDNVDDGEPYYMIRSEIEVI